MAYGLEAVRPMEDLDFAHYLHSDDSSESDFDQDLFHKQPRCYQPDLALARAMDNLQSKSSMKRTKTGFLAAIVPSEANSGTAQAEDGNRLVMPPNGLAAQENCDQYWAGGIDLATPSLDYDCETPTGFTWGFSLPEHPTPTSDSTPDLPPAGLQQPIISCAPSQLSNGRINQNRTPAEVPPVQTSNPPRSKQPTATYSSTTNAPVERRSSSKTSRTNSMPSSFPNSPTSTSQTKRPIDSKTTSKRVKKEEQSPPPFALLSPSSDPELDPGSQEEDSAKLKIYRERNRIAAAKTRKKKKSSAKILETAAQAAIDRNRVLHQEARALRDMVSELRFCALSHDPAQGCGCQDIHKYNSVRAEEVVKGL